MGGDTHEIINYPRPVGCFNRRWRFLGGDTIVSDGSWILHSSFNRRWRFLGGDTQVVGPRLVTLFCFNRRWRFLGGDTPSPTTAQTKSMVSIAGGDSWVGILKTRLFMEEAVGEFQSQVAILGWGYRAGIEAAGRQLSFNRRWRFLGGDTRAAARRHRCQHHVSIAGGDSWVGILRHG